MLKILYQAKDRLLNFCVFLCWITYRRRIEERVKASNLGGSLTIFLAAFGVQFNESPFFIGSILILVVALTSLLLLKIKKWYHYYPVLLSLSVVVFYLFPFR